jgi:RNA polymerase sigma-70 factor (ECF subfamily)
VQPLLGRLEAKYRDAVTMVDLDGLGHADAAAAAGVSVSGMKSRVQRGRRQLKSLLTGCCEVELDARGAPMDARPRTTCACAG